MKSKIILITLAAVALLYSCNTPEKPTPSEQPTKAWTPAMDEPSELALIMRAIHDEARERKGHLEAGELDHHKTDTLFNMVTATPTKEHMKGAGFEGFANAFIQNYAPIDAATTVEAQIEAHNNLITSCIACHHQFCDGPISRIEKLYIN